MSQRKSLLLSMLSFLFGKHANPFLCSAALDSESEKKVVTALKDAMERTKSMVMVTHRLGVIRSLGVNRVVVMEEGQIVESGHPEDLLQIADGHYAALAKEQGISASGGPYNSQPTIPPINI